MGSSNTSAIVHPTSLAISPGCGVITVNAFLSCNKSVSSDKKYSPSASMTQGLSLNRTSVMTGMTLLFLPIPGPMAIIS